MSEENPKTANDARADLQNEDDVKAYWERRDAAQPDFFLGILVHQVEKGVITSFPITLIVGGSLLSGNLVGRRAWLAAQMETAPEVVRDGVMKPWADRWEKVSAEREAESPDEPMPIYFAEAHLRDARWFGTSGGSVPGGATGAFVRVRLSEVQGVMLGSLSVQRD